MHRFQWQPSPNTLLTEALTLDQYHCHRRLSDVRSSKVPCGKLELHSEENVLLLFYDIETTGLNTSKCAMTQFAVQCFVYNCKTYQYIPCYTYSSYVHTTEYITPFITSLTSITQEDVTHAPTFETIVQNIHQSVDTICQTHQITHCFWIAHNGFRFDQPLLSRYLLDHRSQTQYLQSIGHSRRFWCVDTCVLSQRFPYANLYNGEKPKNHKLQTLHEFFIGQDDSLQFHQADKDVSAMIDVFKQMKTHVPNILFQHVSYDTYFMDTMAPQRMVNNVAFDALQGVHGGTIRWTLQQQRILGAPFHQHMCILAGAGCAKTTTLLGRILCLLRSGVPPQRIMLVTFSRDATEDMVTRITQWVGTEVPIVVGTFDALARRYLKDNDEDAFNMCEDVGEYKHAFLRFLQTSLSPQRAQILSSIDYMLVDEYQDINATYHDIISTFAQHGTMITGVGDDAQNIYTWNGSDIQYILEYGEAFHNEDQSYVPVRTYYLTHNFRSTPEILKLANESIARNTRQLPKTIEATRASLDMPIHVYSHQSWTHESQTLIPMIQSFHEQGKSIAILCRNCTNNGPLYFYESECAKHNLPCALLERYRDHRNVMNHERITLCTIHKSKGLEWDVVFMVGCTDSHFPSMDKDITDVGSHDYVLKLEEERRLFYVATTRAKTHLVFSFTQYASHLPHSSSPRVGMTRFLSEIPRSLCTWHNVIQDHFTNTQSYSINREDTPNIKHIKFVHKIYERLSETQWAYLKSLWTSIEHRKVHAFQLDNIQSNTKLPLWVQTDHTHAEVESWCVHVVARMMGETTLPALNAWNHQLNVNRESYALYSAYASEWKTIVSDVETVSVHIAPEDICAFHRLVTKCKSFAETQCIPLSSVRVVCRTHIPRDIRSRVQEAYMSYCDSKRPWNDVLWETFEVSWWQALEQGRMRMVHQHLDHGKERLQELLPLAQAMMKYVGLHQGSEHQRVHVQTPLHYESWSDVAPLIVQNMHTNTCKWMDVSLSEKDLLTSHECIEYTFRALLACKCGYHITSVCVYYPHLGSVQRMDFFESKELDVMWQCMNAICSGEDLSSDINNVLNKYKAEIVKKKERIIMIETKTWKDCCVDDPYQR